MSLPTIERWFLTGIISEESSSNYWWSVNEILDERPMSEVFSILSEFYKDPKKAVQLLKNGGITYLGKTLRECKFTGDTVAFNTKPRSIDCESVSHGNIYDPLKPQDRELFESNIQIIEFVGDRGWNSKMTINFENKVQAPPMHNKPQPQFELF